MSRAGRWSLVLAAAAATAVTAASAPSALSAPNQPAQSQPSVIDIQELRTLADGPVRAGLDAEGRRVIFLEGTLRGAFLPPGPARVAAARAFILDHAALFGLDPGHSDLRPVSVRDEDSGDGTIVFEQYVAGRPVFEGSMVIGHDRDGNVDFVLNRTLPDLDPRAFDPSPAAISSPEDAVAFAGLAVGGSFASAEAEPRLVIVGPGKGFADPRLAWEVQGYLDEPAGDWHVFVDARTGEVVRTLNLLKRAGPPCVPCNPASATGCGLVFYKNAVEFFNNPSLTDASNVNAAQQGCVLGNLTSGTALTGQYVNTSITSNRVGPPYNYVRSVSQPSADEVNTYYHINRAKAYINGLGQTSVMNFSINADAHDNGLGDNSHYVPSTKVLEFGLGGVDDAQDADVIYHEYGHAIQDNYVPNFGTSNEGGAAGEGFGDYWAATITDDSSASALGPACVAAWDATAYNPYNGTVGTGCLRRVDTTKQYPRDMAYEVHDDGEIWSSALWALRSALSPPIADPVILKSHSYVTPSATFTNLADGLLAADQSLYGGTHVTTIHNTLKTKGIPRTATPGSTSGLTGTVAFVCETAHNYASLSYKECTFTQPGAARLRFHFSRCTTESGYDVVRISDGNYNQVQELSGTQFGGGAGYSAVVNGSTIVARLKADGSINAYGFRIDQVQYAPGAVPAGRVPTSAPSVPLTIVRGPADQITLAWGASCSGSDNDYEIYQGLLGNFSSHTPVVCTTSGARVRSIAPASGNRYYLIVPRNGMVEGSYGFRSNGLERPASASACLPQSIAQACP